MANQLVGVKLRLKNQTFLLQKGNVSHGWLCQNVYRANQLFIENLLKLDPFQRLQHPNQTMVIPIPLKQEAPLW